MLAVIHFISNNRSDLEKQLLEFVAAHLFEIEIHSTIEDFLSCYGENRPKERQIKYEDFQEWMGRFHLVLGRWETKREWREVKKHLRTWGPRIISRFTSSNREYVEKRLKNIFGGGISNTINSKHITEKYMAGLKRKFRTIIAVNFRCYQRGLAGSAEKERKLLLNIEPSMPIDDPLQHERRRLVKALSATYEKKREETERIRSRKAFPALLWGQDNESDFRFSDRWFRTLKRQSFQPSDYLIFFDHCPWCLSQNIELRFFKSPAWTWSGRCGRAGWVVKCTGCEEVLLFNLVVMS